MVVLDIHLSISPVQFEELQVSKFLVSMEAQGLPFSLVLNKADLVPEQEVRKRTNQVCAAPRHIADDFMDR